MFQFYHLLPAFTALENVLLPSIIAHGTAPLDAKVNARELLARVGLKGAEYKRPGELSGGWWRAECYCFGSCQRRYCLGWRPK
jgi:lipoprotein-releasing system ATP-binding protein